MTEFFYIVIFYDYSEVGFNLQKIMKTAVKTYQKRKLFVGFASLSYVKEERPLKWNAAAKANLPWLIKNVQ